MLKTAALLIRSYLSKTAQSKTGFGENIPNTNFGMQSFPSNTSAGTANLNPVAKAPNLVPNSPGSATAPTPIKQQTSSDDFGDLAAKLYTKSSPGSYQGNMAMTSISDKNVPTGSMNGGAFADYQNKHMARFGK